MMLHVLLMQAPGKHTHYRPHNKLHARVQHTDTTKTIQKTPVAVQAPPAARSITYLCTKLELVQAPADLVQVLVLLLCFSLNLSRLLAIANLMQALCADTRVCTAAWLTHGMLLLLVVPAVLLLTHGLVVRC